MSSWNHWRIRPTEDSFPGRLEEIDKERDKSNNCRSMGSYRVQKQSSWAVITVFDRIDSFNFDELRAEVSSLVERGDKQLVLDLENAQFLSLPAIKYFASIAERLQGLAGQFALLSPSEKIKRQINIYATLDNMKLFRTRRDLEKAGGQPVPFERPTPEVPEVEPPQAKLL